MQRPSTAASETSMQRLQQSRWEYMTWIPVSCHVEELSHSSHVALAAIAESQRLCRTFGTSCSASRRANLQADTTQLGECFLLCQMWPVFVSNIPGARAPVVGSSAAQTRLVSQDTTLQDIRKLFGACLCSLGTCA